MSAEFDAISMGGKQLVQMMLLSPQVPASVCLPQQEPDHAEWKWPP